MKRVLRLLFRPMLFLAAFVFVAWIGVTLRTALQPSVRLPDGSVLRIVKVDYGDTHEFYRGSELLSRAAEFVSETNPFYYDSPPALRRSFERFASQIS